MRPMVALPLEELGDVVVTDTEAAGKEEAADADADASDGGPPHPVDVKMFEEIFEGVHHAAHARRDQTE